jgi:hypothetical protein
MLERGRNTFNGNFHISQYTAPAVTGQASRGNERRGVSRRFRGLGGVVSNHYLVLPSRAPKQQPNSLASQKGPLDSPELP